MRFSFPTKKTAAGYETTIKIDGQPMLAVCKPTKSEATQAARIEAEAYGFIDGVS